ncbi:MAG: dockerin type I repeat-containing protein, partial [candidate division Zixibacteria bacterium]|nr:dockerin type I repeat-containing protein [candidate division Zixibacteria bacterium]
MSRKPIAVCTILILTLIFMAGAIPVGAVCGDVNGSGIINIQDVGYLIKYLYLEGPPPPNPQDADIDGSGAMNLLDITKLINFLYRGGPQPTCAPQKHIFYVTSGDGLVKIFSAEDRAFIDSLVLTPDGVVENVIGGNRMLAIWRSDGSRIFDLQTQ